MFEYQLRITWIYVAVTGLSGTIALGKDGARNAFYYLSGYQGTEGDLKPYVTVIVDDDGVVCSGDFCRNGVRM